MTVSFIPRSGVIRPEDMLRLQGVFDRSCVDHDIHRDSADADDLAGALLSLASVGVRDEAQLLASLTAFLRQRAKIED